MGELAQARRHEAARREHERERPAAGAVRGSDLDDGGAAHVVTRQPAVPRLRLREPPVVQAADGNGQVQRRTERRIVPPPDKTAAGDAIAGGAA